MNIRRISGQTAKHNLSLKLFFWVRIFEFFLGVSYFPKKFQEGVLDIINLHVPDPRKLIFKIMDLRQFSSDFFQVTLN